MSERTRRERQTKLSEGREERRPPPTPGSLMGPEPPTWVVVRVVKLTGTQEAWVQRVEYLDDEPQVGRVVAAHDFFKAYPPPGWEFESLEWLVFPLIDKDGTTHTIHNQAALDYEAEIVSGKTHLGVSFYVCKVHRLGKGWVIDPPLKMLSNTEFLNQAAEMVTGQGVG